MQHTIYLQQTRIVFRDIERIDVATRRLSERNSFLAVVDFRRWRSCICFLVVLLLLIPLSDDTSSSVLQIQAGELGIESE